MMVFQSHFEIRVRSLLALPRPNQIAEYNRHSAPFPPFGFPYNPKMSSQNYFLSLEPTNKSSLIAQTARTIVHAGSRPKGQGCFRMLTWVAINVLQLSMHPNHRGQCLRLSEYRSKIHLSGVGDRLLQFCYMLEYVTARSEQYQRPGLSWCM